MKSMAFIMMLITLVSKVIGLVREMVMSNFYGTSIVKDAYVTATTIPNVIIGFIVIGVVTSFIPVYKRIQNESEENAERFTSNLFNILMLLFTVIMVFSVAFADKIVFLFAPGYDGIQKELAINFTRLMLFTIYGGAFSGVFRGYLNLKDDFITPLTPAIILNIILIIVIVISAKSDVMILGIGALIAYYLQYLFYLPALKRAKYNHKKILDFKDSNIHLLLKLSIPIIVSTAAMDISGMVDKSIASTLVDAGGVSSLDYAFKLTMLVSGVVITSVTTSIYPKITELGTKNQISEMKSISMSTIVTTFIIVIPSVFGIIALAEPIVKFVYGRGDFDANSVALVSGELIFYAPYLIGQLVRDVISRSFYAVGNTRTPAFVTFITVGSDVVLNFVLSRLMGLNGLALSTTLGSLIGAALIFILYKIKFGDIGLKNASISTLKITIASLLMAFIAVVVSNQFGGSTLGLILAMFVAVLVYAILIVILRVEEVKKLINMIIGRLNRKKKIGR